MGERAKDSPTHTHPKETQGRLAKGDVGKPQGVEQIEVDEPTSFNQQTSRKLRVFIKRQTSSSGGH